MAGTCGRGPEKLMKLGTLKSRWIGGRNEKVTCKRGGGFQE